ncbi:MAG: sugar phosphate isomerase/epimerase family protein [Trebonia sp.]
MSVGPQRLSLNTATVKHLSLRDSVELCQRHEIGGIGLWREQIQEIGVDVAAAIVRDSGLRVSSVCRAGFFTVGPSDWARMLEDNRAAIDEAAAVGADVLVLVSGGLSAGSRSLPHARKLIADAIAELAPVASAAGVGLGIEALHPMFCADRCAISRLGQALELALQFPAETVGVVVDAYHVWWDDAVLDEIARAADRIFSYQVCDWTLPLPSEVLLGRGHVGDGHIEFGPLTQAVEAAGYEGMIEVEIFNEAIWAAPPDETARTVRERFDAHIVSC